MTTYFVDTTNGNNSNNGTSATTPFATIAKAIGASGAATSGDTVYIAPGIYRELVTLGVTPTSELKVIGDTMRSQAWGATTPNGPIMWSGYTTNDYTAPSTSSLLVVNGKNFFTFENIWWVGNSNPATIDALSVVGSHNLTFRRCVIQGRYIDSVFGFSYKGDAATDPNLLFDTCIFIGASTQCSVDCPLHATTNYTATITHRNCLFYGVNSTRSIEVQSSGAGSGKPQGPWVITHCTFAGNISTGGIDPRNSNWATTSIKIYNSLAIAASLGSGNNNTVIASDYNRIFGGSTIQANAVGQNDMGGSSNALVSPPLFEVGQSAIWGLQPRSAFSIWPGSPVNSSFGESSSAQDGSDILSRPRPSGGFVKGFESATTVTGTATSGTTTTLTKTGAGWTVNAFTGYILSITSGTGSGQRRWVASNTATVLTVNYAFITAPDSSSVFSLDAPGALKSPGCFESHDSYLAGGSSNADGATGDCIEIIGAGDVMLRVAVQAVAQVISIKVKWDSNHGDTNKPRAIMIWQPSIGIDNTADTTNNYHEIKTAAGTAGSSYETLTFTSISPTSAGFVQILLQARPDKGNGISYWDTVTVAV